MAVSPVGPAQAALTQVNVRIEGRSKALFEGPLLTEGHDVSSYKADGGNALVEDLAEHPWRRDQQERPRKHRSRRNADGGIG